MFLANVSLFDFRNYAELDLGLERSATVFFGGNAQGKTNLLEAVALTALTRSPRTQQAAEVVRFGQNAARVTCGVQTEAGRNALEVRIILNPSEGGVRASRRFTVNGIPRRSTDMIGALRVVLFWPDDLQLIKGSGEGRRRFLNTLLSQIDGNHAGELNRYSHVLEQRNALLRAIREGRQSTDALDYWTNALAESGATIMVERQRRLLELQPIAAAYHRELSDDRERLELRYRPAGARIGEAPQELVSQQLKAAMLDARDEEIGRGQTVVGPQRDDVEVWLEDHEARLFASQGQQRSAVLSRSQRPAQVDPGTGGRLSRGARHRPCVGSGRRSLGHSSRLASRGAPVRRRHSGCGPSWSGRTWLARRAPSSSPAASSGCRPAAPRSPTSSISSAWP
ncbi:MAG: DNA replication/repair protein RecF [Chloroflexi bacterium]|nr:MAG: DNA replication/repair protein RecF [Chloroflexota bacterium]